jgi:hypothetical protein
MKMSNLVHVPSFFSLSLVLLGTKEPIRIVAWCLAVEILIGHDPFTMIGNICMGITMIPDENSKLVLV